MMWLPKLPPVDAVIAMYDLYESRYGIFNHQDKNSLKAKPLASVAFHECEDFTKGSLLEEMMNLYLVKRIKSIFGISFIDFMELPRDVIQLMFAVSETDAAKKTAEMTQLEQSFGKL